LPGKGTRLAAAPGAVLTRDPAGVDTVSFLEEPHGYPGPTLLREADEPSPQPDPSTAAAPAAQPASPGLSIPPLPATPPTPAIPSFEEVYEQVVERLRRDLLVERERMGDLLGNQLP
jgi:hypothetical protein